MQTIRERPRVPTLLKVKKDPVKLTALLYLKEAIQKEKYEEAPEFIEIAREFGAKEREIEELLEDSRRTPR